MNTIRNILLQGLQHPLPGPDIWKRWAARSLHAPANAKQAGVLICLYQRKDDIYLPVMMRPARSGPHSGQISLPGGAFEGDRDASLIDTALREAEEEMGITQVSVVGTLSSLYIPVSGFKVQPVIGTVDTLPSFRPDPAEVERIIEVPVSSLLDRKNQTIHTFQYQGQTVQTPGFRVGGELIWGATALILSEFLHVFERSTSATGR